MVNSKSLTAGFSVIVFYGIFIHGSVLSMYNMDNMSDEIVIINNISSVDITLQNDHYLDNKQLFDSDKKLLVTRSLINIHTQPPVEVTLNVTKNGIIQCGDTIELSKSNNQLLIERSRTKCENDETWTELEVLYRFTNKRPPIICGMDRSLWFTDRLHEQRLAIENINLALVKIICQTKCAASLCHQITRNSYKKSSSMVKDTFKQVSSSADSISAMLAPENISYLELMGKGSDVMGTLIKLFFGNIAREVHFYIDEDVVSSGDKLILLNENDCISVINQNGDEIASLSDDAIKITLG